MRGQSRVQYAAYYMRVFDLVDKFKFDFVRTIHTSTFSRYVCTSIHYNILVVLYFYGNILEPV